MSWKCFLVTVHKKRVTRKDGRTFVSVFRDAKGNEYVGEDQLPIGATWLNAESHYYGIKLPGECGLNRFCPQLEYDGHRWEVAGEFPNVTVTLSINTDGHYHGTIKDGVISDDLEGRKYTNTGLRHV